MTKRKTDINMGRWGYRTITYTYRHWKKGKGTLERHIHTEGLSYVMTYTSEKVQARRMRKRRRKERRGRRKQEDGKEGHKEDNHKKDEDGGETGGGHEGKAMLLLKGNKAHVDMSRIATSAFALLIFRTINTYCVMSKRLHQLWYVEQNNISRVVTQHSDGILSCDLMRWELAREVCQGINWRHWSPGQHAHQLKGQRNVHLVLKYNSK